MKSVLRNSLLAATIAGAGTLIGCGGVSGNTYQAPGGGYQIEFQSSGKAIESLGPEKDVCTYVEDSKSVTVTCPDGKTIFTINEQKQLVPPAGSMLGVMGPLTKK